MATLFEKMYNASSAVIKQFKQPLVARKVKRKFESAFDNAMDVILQRQEDLREQIEKVEELDLEQMVKYYKEIEKQKEVCRIVSTIHNELFGEELSGKADIEKDIFGEMKEIQ